MEFFPGEALESIERVPNQKSKYYVFTFLMDAVFKMHKLHIVHADLHFGNVLYKNDVDMLNLFSEEGLVHLSTEQMPANNLAFILQKV